MEKMKATMSAKTFDLTAVPLRDVNAALHDPGLSGDIVIECPAGAHNVAVGVDAPVNVTVEGHVGYYAAGRDHHYRQRGHRGGREHDERHGVGEGQRVAVSGRDRTRRTAGHRG
jgi:hypothetical protein